MDLLSIHDFKLLLFLNKVISSIKPWIKLIERRLPLVSPTHISIPDLHFCQPCLELLLRPHKLSFFSLFVLAHDNKHRFSLLIVIDIDNHIELKMNIPGFERILLIPKNCIVISLIYIIHCLFELFKETSEGILVQSMLQFLKEYLNVLSFIGISIQTIVQELPISSHTLHQIDFLARNNELEGICMAEGYSIQVLYLYPFIHVQTVDKEPRVLVREDENLSSLVDDRTVPLHNTESIELNIILFSLISSNFNLPLLQVIHQHASQGWIFRNIHDIR